MAFEGLGSSLQILDLSANNITSLPDSVFDNFDVFRLVFGMVSKGLHVGLTFSFFFQCS